MTREEMIEMARVTRNQVTNAPVPEELLDRYPAEVKEMNIPGRAGDIHCYLSNNKSRNKNEDVLIINFHGGGFIRGRTANDEVFCRRINEALECKVLDLDYKIAPDFPYPLAFHEAFDTVKWAFEHTSELGVDRKKIVLAGHSAGGNLAICAVMKALEEGEFVPAALIADYPPLDLYTDPGDKKSMGKGIPAERARLYNLFYCDRDKQKEPYVSPIYAPDGMLRNFPKTLIMTAGTDDLCNEAEEFALRLARNGNEITIKRFLNAKHGFTIYRTDGCDGAIELITRFIRNCLEI